MSKPRLLDLYSGAGGAAEGYHRAGFDVTGVDNRSQPHYPFAFIQADALEYLAGHGGEYEAFHASPPCQAHSSLKYVTGKEYTDLIPITRELLIASGKPYVIENVERAPLLNPITLCGTMFGLKVFRHRKFETSFFMLAPEHISHRWWGARVGRCGHREIDASGFMSIAGHFSNVAHAREAMGIDWMVASELAQAIPPAYTEYIGKQLLETL